VTHFQMLELMKKSAHRDKMLKIKGGAMTSGIQQMQTANEMLNQHKKKKKKYQIILVKNNLLIQLDNRDKDLISIPINQYFNIYINFKNELQLDINNSKYYFVIDEMIEEIIEEVFEILKNVKNKGII